MGRSMLPLRLPTCLLTCSTSLSPNSRTSESIAPPRFSLYYSQCADRRQGFSTACLAQPPRSSHVLAPCKLVGSAIDYGIENENGAASRARPGSGDALVPSSRSRTRRALAAPRGLAGIHRLRGEIRAAGGASCARLGVRGRIPSYALCSRIGSHHRRSAGSGLGSKRRRGICKLFTRSGEMEQAGSGHASWYGQQCYPA